MNINVKDRNMLLGLNIIFLFGFGFVYLNEKLNNFERILFVYCFLPGSIDDNFIY